MRRRRMKAPSGPVEIELHPILVDDQALLEHTFVHELLHVKIPNHGKLWKAIMTSFFKNYKKLEIKLNS